MIKIEKISISSHSSRSPGPDPAMKGQSEGDQFLGEVFSPSYGRFYKADNFSLKR